MKSFVGFLFSSFLRIKKNCMNYECARDTVVFDCLFCAHSRINKCSDVNMSASERMYCLNIGLSITLLFVYLFFFCSVCVCFFIFHSFCVVVCLNRDERIFCFALFWFALSFLFQFYGFLFDPFVDRSLWRFTRADVQKLLCPSHSIHIGAPKTHKAHIYIVYVCITKAQCHQSENIISIHVNARALVCVCVSLCECIRWWCCS